MPTPPSQAAGIGPWWHHAGEEHCPHCGEPYLYELEFRCTECDGPGCMHCRELHVEGHYVCPLCVDRSDAAAPASQPGRTRG